MTPSLSDRFAGCLLGQALGDALGFVVEGYLPADCRSYVEGTLRTGQAGEARRLPFAPGQYTDDTQLARELLRSFVARRRFDPQEYAQRLAALFYERKIVGEGRATALAARQLLRGHSWEESGTPAPAAGNGSAMRAGPLGLLFPGDPGGMVTAARQQAQITHRDPRCLAGAVTIAGAVALAVQAEHLEVGRFVGQLYRWVLPVEEGFATHLRDLLHWITLPPESAVLPISRAGIDPGGMDLWEGISPFVLGSVLWSLYSFLRTPADPWETLCTAIAVGGDVDTTAAMAGAISGAFNGATALPGDLLGRLHDRESWREAELRELAQQAYQIVHGES